MEHVDSFIMQLSAGMISDSCAKKTFALSCKKRVGWQGQMSIFLSTANDLKATTGGKMFCLGPNAIRVVVPVLHKFIDPVGALYLYPRGDPKTSVYIWYPRWLP